VNRGGRRREEGLRFLLHRWVAPSPIVPMAPPSQPSLPGGFPMPQNTQPAPSPNPPGPYGPAPTPQGSPAPGAINPYQSQVVPPATAYAHTPQAFLPTGTPQHGVPAAQPAPPTPSPGTAPVPPRKPERTGTLPAIPVAQVAVTPQMPPVAPVVPPALGSRPATTGTLPVAPRRPPSFASDGGGPRIMVKYPQVGSKLTGQRGTYEVRDVIGSGEFGAVYECIGPFDQIYAVKMVRPSNRPYSEVHAEWAREVKRLFTLRHPNVVYIYDSFAHDHLFYLALERCDHPLKAMLGTPMQEGLVIEISRQLLAAVQFLHDNDVVHDDLHGGNVLITHTDRPTVKISDFGISNELRGMTAVRPNIVHHAIMAPEILSTGYTSRQSDLYQVGLLIYWMLTGESAMQMDVPYQELVRQVAEGEPRQRAEQLGTPLGNLIAKMLRRREAFRYTSAREVWADLRELPAWKQRQLFPAR
jgi:hypothetical protein